MTENYDKYENIFDLIIKKTFDNIYPLFKKLNITPNHLTLIGFICGLLGAYYLYKNNLTYFSIFWLLAVLFDTLDGDYSRKYKMYSEFGKWFDFITDWIRICILSLVFIYSYNIIDIINENRIILIILTLLFVNTLFFLSCYKKKTKQNHFITQWCFLNDNKLNKYLTYGSFFSDPIFSILLVFLINYFKNYRKN